MLEMVVADISIFEAASSDRIAVFRLYTRCFSDLQASIEPRASGLPWERRAEETLGRISPVSRQAFLLAAVESFGPEEIGEILDVPAGEVRDLLARASQELSRQVATSVLIIEDEPLIAMDIRQILVALGHRVTGVARTRGEALALFEADPPGMVLADIQLADGSSGLDAINEILTVRSMPVIFVTAFPEALLTGERPEPTYLITKPFDPDMVTALVSQALFFDEAAEVAAAGRLGPEHAQQAGSRRPAGAET
jgi:CheY-like chemotaxis protein